MTADYNVRMQRMACPQLQPYLSSVWSHSPTAGNGWRREHVLPTGAMHLVIRLGGDDIRIHGAEGAPAVCGSAFVAGARSAHYVKDTHPAGSVGVMLRPGMTEAVLGIPASELAGRHWLLEDLWGSAGRTLVARLTELAEPATRVELLDSFLLARLQPHKTMHPSIAFALEGFDPDVPVAEMVRASGCSHRAFVSRFRSAVGLTPKTFARVQRFNDMLRQMRAAPQLDWASVAAVAGYSDQSHMHREFLAFAGMTPGHYRARAVAGAAQVEVNFVQDAVSARG